MRVAILAVMGFASLALSQTCDTDDAIALNRCVSDLNDDTQACLSETDPTQCSCDLYEQARVCYERHCPEISDLYEDLDARLGAYCPGGINAEEAAKEDKPNGAGALAAPAGALVLAALVSFGLL